jgi:Family of unknown function (DUF6491)
MKYPARYGLLFLVALAVLSACSSVPRRERDRQALAQYMDYAGAPVDSFTYFGRFSGFQTLGRYQLVVFTGVNDAYLLTVAPPCMDLEFATGVGFTSTAHTVYRGFDSVRFNRERCMITEIRPINYREMKKAMREEKEGT